MSESRLVYSTERGHVDQPEPRLRVASPSGRERSPGAVPEDGVVRVFRERGGRGGKVVTVVRGLPDRGAALEGRAAELKRLCGAGGTVKNGAVEIQGDHRDRVAGRLRALGHTVKLAGG